jgi:hypothetical protein
VGYTNHHKTEKPPDKPSKGSEDNDSLLKRERNIGVTAKHVYLEDLQAQVHNGKFAQETAQP